MWTLDDIERQLQEHPELAPIFDESGHITALVAPMKDWGHVPVKAVVEAVQTEMERTNHSWAAFLWVMGTLAAVSLAFAITELLR